ncbi:Crp/Fnr family transcriptional regulator [Amycolatopsis sp. H20-H5]|uniref:Crp/Fnr family transcriptional regulator n=1 Tax=Amycolatopsis sp. H20-H5 TaxID=3046309 RepID=UPI002DBDED8A|nr:Crp/Fnr family transcriptional regulator [Amycolatopsis sp. H20-H5]MEC3977971.1 Crp/Fnr family transcriptional regulator [Amycolatopsis sp. H20-H5]
MELLPPASFGARLGREALEELRRTGIAKKYSIGDLLFMQGDDHGNVFLVESGQVKVYVTGPEGAVLILGIYGRGEVLCEMSALEQLPRSASGVARTPTVVTEINGRNFRAYVRRNPDVMSHVLSVMRHRLHKADDERLSYLSEGVVVRVTRKLLAWAATYGAVELDGRVEILGFTRRDLAQSVAAAEKSVDDVLSTLTNAGLITTGRRRFVLLAPAQLQAWPEHQARP